MKIQYRHCSEPDTVKIHDTDQSFDRNPFTGRKALVNPGLAVDTTKEEWDQFVLDRMKEDQKKGYILEYTVLKDVTEAEKEL